MIVYEVQKIANVTGNKINDIESIILLGLIWSNVWILNALSSLEENGSRLPNPFESVVDEVPFLLSNLTCFEHAGTRLAEKFVWRWSNDTQTLSNQAAKTKPMHTTRNRSTAFNPVDVGELLLMPISIKINPINTVTMIPILSEILVGFRIKDPQVEITHIMEVKYTLRTNWVKSRSRKILNPHALQSFP